MNRSINTVIYFDQNFEDDLRRLIRDEISRPVFPSVACTILEDKEFVRRLATLVADAIKGFK